MITLLKKYWLSILVILIIFILCFMNTTPFPAAPVHNFDKLVHVIMMSGLCGVIFFDNTIHLRAPISRMRILWGSFLFPIAIGGLIEIMQEYLTPTRSGDWYDFLFDVVGAIPGWVIVLIINRYFLMKKKSI